MGDQDSDQELPQRVRGAARAGPRPSAARELSDEVRQRMQAAVLAERADAVQDDADAPTGPLPRVSTPAPDASQVVKPASPKFSRPRPSETTPVPAPPEPAASLPAPSAPAPPEPVVTETSAHANGAAGHANGSTTHANGSTTHANGASAHANGATDRAAAPPVPAARPERGRRLRSSRLRVVLAVLLVAALSATAAWYFTRAPVGPSPAALQQKGAASRSQAASWIVQQVSHSALVSCDQQMCTALTTAGFPARDLSVLTPTSPYPAKSALVVVTAAVREIFGSSLSAGWAPIALATFGSGDAQVSVRVIGPHGAAAYQAAARADLGARQMAGAALLEVPGLDASDLARQQLTSGQVDARLLLAIAHVAADQPLDMIDFGNLAPGQDAGVPLRYADLAENGQAGQDSAAYVRSIVAELDKVSTQFRPASTTTVVLPGGQKALRVLFLAPSTLGLLGG